MPKVFTGDETDYVEKADAAGTMKGGEMIIVMVLARLLEKKPMEVQKVWMDVKVGLNQYYAQDAGIVDPVSGKILKSEQKEDNDAFGQSKN